MALSKAVSGTVNAILAAAETTPMPFNDTEFPREAAVARPEGGGPPAAAFHNPLVGLLAIIGAFVVLAALIIALVRLRPRRRHARPEDELCDLRFVEAP